VDPPVPPSQGTHSRLSRCDGLLVETLVRPERHSNVAPETAWTPMLTGLPSGSSQPVGLAHGFTSTGRTLLSNGT
jgi:hypothetical protein